MTQNLKQKNKFQEKLNHNDGVKNWAILTRVVYYKFLDLFPSMSGIERL